MEGAATVTVNYGGRFDVVNGYTIGNQLSPRLNTVWTGDAVDDGPCRLCQLFHAAAAGTGLDRRTSPSMPNTSAAPAVTEKRPIKNESAQYFDAGVTQEVLPGLKLGVDLYYKYSRNLLDEGQFGAPVVLTPFNYHIGINQGIELTTNYTVGNFTFYGNLAIAKQKAKGIELGAIQLQPRPISPRPTA